MAVGHSDDVDPSDAIAAAIDQCRGQLDGLTPQAGLLFAAFDSFDPDMVTAVRVAFPGVTVTGSTSSAEMSSTVGYREDSVTLALFAADGVDLTAGLGMSVDVDADAACRAAVTEAMAGTDKPPRLGILLTDGINGQRTLDAMTRAMPEGVTLIGGAASGTTLGTPLPSFQFCNERTVERGVALMLFSGALAFSYAVGTGLRPIGPRGVVTSSSDGIIHEIDGRPAAHFIAGYLDVAGPATFGNPLAFDDSGSGDWYLRVMIAQDAATGDLQIPGSVPVGAMIQLTTATTEEIVGATSDAVRRATAAFPGDGEPSAALVFSCAVRKFLLGSRTSQEVAEALARLPAALPLAGMYCTGEIAPVGADAGSRFLNESFVTLLLGG